MNYSSSMRTGIHEDYNQLGYMGIYKHYQDAIVVRPYFSSQVVSGSNLTRKRVENGHEIPQLDRIHPSKKDSPSRNNPNKEKPHPFSHL